jgi:hypothetical protein
MQQEISSRELQTLVFLFTLVCVCIPFEPARLESVVLMRFRVGERLEGKKVRWICSAVI